MRSQLAEPASNSLKIQNHRSLTIFRWSTYNRDSILDCFFSSSINTLGTEFGELEAQTCRGLIIKSQQASQCVCFVCCFFCWKRVIRSLTANAEQAVSYHTAESLCLSSPVCWWQRRCSCRNPRRTRWRRSAWTVSQWSVFPSRRSHWRPWTAGTTCKVHWRIISAGFQVFQRLQEWQLMTGSQ